LMVAYDNTIVATVKKAADAAGYKLPGTFATKGVDALWAVAVLLSVVVLIWAIWQAKRVTPQMEAMERGE
ncbi:MAG: hypothetical protein V1809_16165, partial [Planctomycetota bacterium]